MHALLFLVALNLQPGQYLTKGAEGSLTIQAKSQGGQRFHLLTLAGDGSSCALEGTVPAGQDRANLEGLNKAENCIVTFKTLANGGIAIGAVDQELCQAHCGSQVPFVGSYDKVNAACQAELVSNTLAEFKLQYQAKDYARAKQTLSTLLTSCGSYLPWTQKDWAINNLALTHHQLGDDRACLQALKPYQTLMKSSDAKIREDYPPFAAVMKQQLVKALRKNAQLCGSKDHAPPKTPR